MAGGEGMQFTVEGLTSTKAARIRALDVSAAPASFVGNTHKEELCLEYVENFRRQFGSLFPGRRELFLTALNECDVRKFVCTSLRPTQLPFKDAYSLAFCAEFFAHFLEYEPLEDPTAYPKYLPSPSAVLQWRVGDSFDCAFTLTSYLLGNGYDAYVVIGTAPQAITLRDQSNTTCPVQIPTDLSGSVSEMKPSSKEDEAAPTSNKYQPSNRGPVRSQYIVEVERRAAAAAAATGEVVEESSPVHAPYVDPLEGRRVHAWVLVRAGLRDLEEHLFVEPSTGRTYPVTASPYLSVEAVLNNKNYWVNMQHAPRAGAAGGKTAVTSVNNLSFDLDNTDNWEYVFIDTLARSAQAAVSRNVAEEREEMQDRGEDDDGHTRAAPTVSQGAPVNAEETGHILDLPPSWVPKLVMDRDMFIERYGVHGCRTILYRGVKLQLFTPYTHPAGLVLIMSKFSDAARTLLVEQVELFEHRDDKLVKRVRYPMQRKLVEHFASGRSQSLKTHTEIMGKWRQLEFYTAARLDGLVSRTDEIGVKSTEIFQDRDDRLVYRSVSLIPASAESSRASAARATPAPSTGTSKLVHFSLQTEAGDMLIRKMTEKFARNKTLDADKDVAKRVYLVQEKTIREEFHYADGRITASSRLYHKDAPEGQIVEITSMNPFAQKPKESELDADYRRVLAQEKECNHSIREALRECSEILTQRQNEEKEIALEKSIFDLARERSKTGATQEATQEEDKDQAADGKVDYLTPFLAKAADPNNPTYEEAVKADKDCRKALKDRLIERVNIIQRRLDEENEELAKRQAAYQRSQREQLAEGAEEEYDKYCAEAMFRIGILEARLQHQEETVLAKFTELEMMLKSDERLRVLYGNESTAGSTNKRDGTRFDAGRAGRK